MVSLNSVLTYRGMDKRTPEIAIELGVNFVLEGTYKKIGDKVRVTAQLIEQKIISEPGVYCSEEIVPTKPFFNELKKRNIIIDKQIT